MNLSSPWLVPLARLRQEDASWVGGKNASLGEMAAHLRVQGIQVPEGFAFTTHAFEAFLRHNSLDQRIPQRLEGMETWSLDRLTQVSQEIRDQVAGASFPPEMEEGIFEALQGLNTDSSCTFAVRSSATAEDAPEHSFAGQQETFLHVSHAQVLPKIRAVLASLYHERALSYRIHKGLHRQKVLMSVGVQCMVHAQDAVSGVMFTLHPESGFPHVVLIHATYGLGEALVQGAVDPDEFWVFKPTLKAGKDPILRRSLGSKHKRMGYAGPEVQDPLVLHEVPKGLQEQFALSDEDVIQLARYGVLIEEHYGRPMDIEWAKDSRTGQLCIVQARPETVQSQKSSQQDLKYTLTRSGPVCVTGQAIGQRIGHGPVKIIRAFEDMHRIQHGDILVTETTHPQWEPAMKQAAAIVTNRGGRTCHAAILAREIGVPAVVGCGHATEVLQDHMMVTVSCAEGEEGRVYEGILPFDVTEAQAEETVLPPPPVPIMMNVGNPQQAFHLCQYPQAGVGLARLEFIINHYVGIHPRAALAYPHVEHKLKETLEYLARGYPTPREFYIAKLTGGIATIAAAFYPNPVIVRLSDFKSHEYKKLVGGPLYEPEEENPMLGFRGVSRYLSEGFALAFALECEALCRVRDQMGLTNVDVMVPFVRTVDQARRVTELLAHHGLERGSGAAEGRGLKIIMMCEVPSNALLADDFLAYFDGFSIGSNDLTQLTLGLDRDAGLACLNQDFNERDPALLFLFSRAIQACRAQGKYVGICGQGPSDHPDFARWLVTQGISSLSLNPDSVMRTWRALL